MGEVIDTQMRFLNKRLGNEPPDSSDEVIGLRGYAPLLITITEDGKMHFPAGIDPQTAIASVMAATWDVEVDGVPLGTVFYKMIADHYSNGANDGE